MRKEFLIDCHCEECNDEAIRIPKWIAALPLVARNDGKRAAFTLAEVLITLTIIGVIAALTIPNLMQSYKKHQVEVGVKEAYAITSNMFKIIEAENNTVTDVIEQLINQNNEKYAPEFVDKYVKQNLKYLKYCPTGMDKYECGIFAESAKSTGYINYLNGETCTGYVCAVKEMERFILNNGMYIGFPAHNSYKDGISILFDINGSKGPNKLGYDLFFIDIPVACNGKIIGGTGMGATTCKPKLTSCRTNEQYGTECINPIMLNSWKIPDDYPVKKF